MCATVGIGVGVATQLLQGVLPGDANWAANSLSAWLVVAFGAASRAPLVRSAAAGAVALLLAALVGYEVVVEARFGTGWGSLVSFWAAGVALLAALFVAEGVYLSAILVDRNVGIVLVGLGLAIPLILSPTWRQRRTAYLVLLPCLALGAAGYAAMLVAYGWWAGR